VEGKSERKKIGISMSIFIDPDTSGKTSNNRAKHRSFQANRLPGETTSFLRMKSHNMTIQLYVNVIEQ